MDDFSISVDDLLAVPAFQGLPLEQVERLKDMMIRQSYEAGQIIFLEGEPVRGLWFVAAGRVKIMKQSLNGRVQGLCLMNRNKCFGGCPLFDTQKNPATAEALTRVTLFILPGEQLEHFTEREPLLVSSLLRLYSQRLGHLARISEVLGTWTVSDRINDCLRSYARQSGGELLVELTHEKLAALAGTVREVVTRHLAELERGGFVRGEPGRILILNPDALLPPCAFDDEPAAV